ncbi:conserved hypothetical protein [Paraburkholderia piptadeniae]|uniref:Zinc ribbon domain-containing protein n=1 Tax=Paraburkholderia piptadeniae TaxID=1701573 RepID=A0A1N7RPM6_9BURK|nr:hypothetical protein [Paraburkholderia piptadeniae]SIT37075.1 conserved hypothetical protein [Paraburkholderia piptadeniae]
MGDQTAHGPIFPATCARCGGRVSGTVSFCPHCGVPARLAFGDRAPKKKPRVAATRAASVRANILRDRRLWPWRSTPFFQLADTDHSYGGARPPMRSGAGRRGLKTGAVLMLPAVVVLFGGAVLLHRSVDSDTRDQRARSSIVQGTVTSDDMDRHNPASTIAQGPTTAQGSEATGGSITPQNPATEERPTITTAVPPTTGASSVTPAMTASTAASRPSQASFSASQNEETSSQYARSNDRGYGGRHHRLISLALARAHDGLEKNDLRTARSGVYWALSLQPDNRDALLMKMELVSRERARDAALKAARSCAGEERRQCVWQNASNALSIDSSSTGAKALVEHSNVDSGKTGP